MGIKVYVSGMSGNKEVKKRQQSVLMILDSKNIKYTTIDITEPGKEPEKEFMQANSTSKSGSASDPNPRHPLPPQLFNDQVYCGDFDDFDMANETDSLEQFLKLEPVDTTNVSTAQVELNKSYLIRDSNPRHLIIEVGSNQALLQSNQSQNILC
jgi:SH3 domain-binding glutamic acid-rich protein